MSALRVGFIGTGKKPEKPIAVGYGMAHQHGLGYKGLPNGEVEIVACADIVRDNAEDFAGRFGIPKTGVYTDYNQMLAKEKLDIVSICTWPRLHEKMVVDTARAKPKGIFSEKPMSDTWGGSKRMHQACVDNNVFCAYNHQRRFGKPFRLARKLIDDGVIGKVERVEYAAHNLFDYGTHSFDLSGYLNGSQDVKWIIAQIDYRTENLIFGTHNENQSIAQWEYANGVLGFMAAGLGARQVGAHNKVIGSDGVIEIGSTAPESKDKHLRFRTYGNKEWQYVDTAGENCHGPGFIERAVADFIACTKAGKPSELDSSTAIKVTELIYAAYESSRIRARIDLPLTIEDNPLAAMVESGALNPKKA